MDVYLFLDESGDHGLKNINQAFPVLVLCGILVSEGHHRLLNERINNLKEDIWGTRDIIFHSTEIRKCEGDFKILADKPLRDYFIMEFNKIVTGSYYRILSTAIRKNSYKVYYHSPFQGVYERALTFLLERCIFCLDELRHYQPRLKIIIESRGQKEDLSLAKHIDKLKRDGSEFVESFRFKEYDISYKFLKKNLNVNGLQFADLLAYPIARYVINKFEPNVNFQLLKDKIYQNGQGKIQGFGLKVFP